MMNRIRRLEIELERLRAELDAINRTPHIEVGSPLNVETTEAGTMLYMDEVQLAQDLQRIAINQGGVGVGSIITVPSTGTAIGDNYTFTSPDGTVTITASSIAAPVPTVSALTGGSLTEGVIYYYVLTTVTPFGESLQSTQVSYAPAGGNDKAHLTWPQVNGATGYKIYRTTISGDYASRFALLATINSGSTLSYDDVGLTYPSAGNPPFVSTAGSLVTFVVGHVCPDLTSISGLLEFAFDGNIRTIPDATTSFNWTSPPCPIDMLIECWGQGSTTSGVVGTGDGFGGGGGGAYASKKLLAVAPSTVFRLFVDGTGSTAYRGKIHAAYQATSVDIVYADSALDTTNTAGGLGGLAANSLGDVVFSGGNGGAGIAFKASGGGGSAAGPQGNGANGSAAYTLGGINYGGDGGQGYSPGGSGDATNSGVLTMGAVDGSDPGAGAGGGTGLGIHGFPAIAWFGEGLVRIQWGKSVTSVNGDTGAVAIAATSGLAITKQPNGVIQIAPNTFYGTGPPAATLGTAPAIYFDVTDTTNIQFYYKS